MLPTKLTQHVVDQIRDLPKAKEHRHSDRRLIAGRAQNEEREDESHRIASRPGRSSGACGVGSNRKPSSSIHHSIMFSTDNRCRRI
jgi:hypothetical protein